MISKEHATSARQRAHEMLTRAGIVLTPQEAANIEVTDAGLGDLENVGLQLVVYVNTERICAKELVMFPHQSFPQHRHPAVDGEPGKEETFRCRGGQVYLYVSGEPTPNPKGSPPRGRERYYTAWHEVVLNPGEQYTLMPDIPHWFQAGPKGAIVSEFSTRSRDETDVFIDPDVVRMLPPSSERSWRQPSSTHGEGRWPRRSCWPWQLQTATEPEEVYR